MAFNSNPPINGVVLDAIQIIFRYLHTRYYQVIPGSMAQSSSRIEQIWATDSLQGTRGTQFFPINPSESHAPSHMACHIRQELLGRFGPMLKRPPARRYGPRLNISKNFKLRERQKSLLRQT
jgi:hypothetical protein